MSEMLIDGAKLDACLDAEADAIRAKTGDSNDLTFDFANNKGFADAIDSIQTGGGGSLPTSISKIDGGSFTFASATNGTYSISHSLGTTPKGFVIWTDEIDLANSDNNTVIRGVFIVDKSVDSETSYLYQMSVYNHAFNNYTRSVGASYSGYANSSTISYNVGNVHYASGINYKWFAWA